MNRLTDRQRERGRERNYILLSLGNFNQQEVDQIVKESLKMSQFKHDHVMGLIGVCIDADPIPYIVMPYMANGSLLRYLNGERGSLVLSGNADKKIHKLFVLCHSCAEL